MDFFQVVMGAYPGLKPPMVAGIDLVGTVEETSSGSFKVTPFTNHIGFLNYDFLNIYIQGVPSTSKHFR
jgi:hypothetical protein